MSVAAQVAYGQPLPSLAPEPALRWVDVCALDEIPVDCGAAALVGGRQIALVRIDLRDNGERQDLPEVYALSNYDPFSEAFVIARGIVGDRDGRPKIASPIYKQSFDLRTGVCFDDPDVSLFTYPVRITEGRIEVGVPSVDLEPGPSR